MSFGAGRRSDRIENPDGSAPRVVLPTLETEKEEYGDWAEVLDWARNTLPYDSTTLQVIESYQDGLIPIADYEGRLNMVARMLKAEAAKAARTI